MNILQKISLKDYSTMRLGGVAQYLIEITSKDELIDAVSWAKTEKLDVIMIGRGSNIIWSDDGFDGLILVNKILGFETSDRTQNEVFVTIGAGENWDSVVSRTTELGLSGIETLSLIPGSTGATPVQNVGAYGTEISKSLISIEVYDRKTDKFTVLKSSDCEFGYRTSNFKTKDKKRYFIVAITLRLSREMGEIPFYDAIQEYINTHNLDSITPQILRDIVIEIRQSKLPDPEIVANSGSFFTNPIIDNKKFLSLQKSYPTMPYWQVKDGSIKLAAAWLIDQCGYKAVSDPVSGISVWPTQSLVLVNSSAKKTADLMTFKKKIVKDVESKFGVEIIQEPELLPLIKE